MSRASSDKRFNGFSSSAGLPPRRTATLISCRFAVPFRTCFTTAEHFPAPSKSRPMDTPLISAASTARTWSSTVRPLFVCREFQSPSKFVHLFPFPPSPNVPLNLSTVLGTSVMLKYVGGDKEPGAPDEYNGQRWTTYLTFICDMYATKVSFGRYFGHLPTNSFRAIQSFDCYETDARTIAHLYSCTLFRSCVLLITRSRGIKKKKFRRGERATRFIRF